MNYDQPSDSRDEFRSDQENNNRYYDSPDAGEKLPADPIALTLGIVSLVSFFVFCWCYGVIALITLVISIGLWEFTVTSSVSIKMCEPH